MLTRIHLHIYTACAFICVYMCARLHLCLLINSSVAGRNNNKCRRKWKTLKKNAAKKGIFKNKADSRWRPHTDWQGIGECRLEGKCMGREEKGVDMIICQSMNECVTMMRVHRRRHIYVCMYQRSYSLRSTCGRSLVNNCIV